MKRLTWLALALLGAVGCSASPYVCASGDQCVGAGQNGLCVPSGAANYCAFQDVLCPSGLRWDASAAPSLAGTCVMSDAAMDMSIPGNFGPSPDFGRIVDLSPTPCGDADPQCVLAAYGPPNSVFPLMGDPQPNPAESDQAMARDHDGDLVLAGIAGAGLNYVAITSSEDGTVSRLDATKVRELGRYPSVSCMSLDTGSTAQCDGTKGCCAIDDWYRYQARKAGQNLAAHQAVQTMTNYPAHAAVDLDGDLFVSNRAFGGQSSVTKIANDHSACIDRNHNGKIDTSSDTDGDGFIETDCNGDSLPDDIAGVKAKPCTNGLAQEYYGNDDECVLWTSNTFVTNDIGRAMTLGPGAPGAANSDVWAGSFQDGTFVRIDGTTGLDKADTRVETISPFALTVDRNGIAWAGPIGSGTLCYFDTNKPANIGCARTPNGFTASSWGITLDRDQNVWLGGSVVRYTPDRSNGFNSLGNGFWMKIDGVEGNGIAADSRSANAYWVWSCNGGGILQIPASTIPMPGKMGQAAADFQVTPAGWTTINMPCNPVAVDGNQNIWGVDAAGATRAFVDVNGKVTQPTVDGQAMGNNKCPAGDSCPIGGTAEEMSDLTGFGLRNFGERAPGTWKWIQTGCGGGAAPTSWYSVTWDADVPPNTTLGLRYRSGNTAVPDQSWGTWSAPVSISPADLRDGNLIPNDLSDGYLQIEFLFNSTDPTASPALKSFVVAYRC